MYGDSEIEKKVRETLERKSGKAVGWEQLVDEHPSPWDMSPYAWAEDKEPSRSDKAGILGMTSDEAVFDVMEERRADMYGKCIGRFEVGVDVKTGEMWMKLKDVDTWRL